MSVKQQNWKWVINSQTTWFGPPLKELLAHKDLLFGLVRKDLLSSYQQTLLGPLWIILQPIFSVIIYVIVFSRIIGLKTDDVPPFLFFLLGITLWNLFSDLLTNTASAITSNVHIYSKVYFPRLISPLSTLVLNLLRFLIHFTLLIFVVGFYAWRGDIDFQFPHILLSILPVIIVTGFAFGIGLIFSVLTAKYRDLGGLLQLFLRLFMFICPIFYSISTIPSKYRFYMDWNPLAYHFELFRYAFTGKGVVDINHLVMGALFMLLILASGILLFNKMTDKLMDVA